MEAKRMFRRKMFRIKFKDHHAAHMIIQKLKLGANQTTGDRDMVDQRFCNSKIDSVMTAIFQDGGQTDKFRRKMFRIKFKDHHAGYPETQTRCKSDYR